MKDFFADIRYEYGIFMVILVLLFCFFAGMALLGIVLSLLKAVI